MPGVRDARRAQGRADLLAAARDELAEAGAAGLAIRSVARRMGMAPSALFRYISGRDELLTWLIVDAYNDLGTTVEAAEADVPRDDLRGRWRALAASFRGWAHEHPHEYALLYGSPVPDYDAPGDTTNDPGTRVTNLLVALGQESPDPGPPFPGLPDAAPLDALADTTGMPAMDATRLLCGLLAWTSLVGAVSSELFEQIGADMARLDILFDATVAQGEWLLFGR